MGALTGKNLFLKFGDTTLETDFRAFSPTETGGVVDGSAGADANRTYLTTLKDGTATVTVLVQAADTNTWDALVPGTAGTLIWGEEGSQTGTLTPLQMHTVWAYVTERRKSMAYADILVADLSWQYSGAVVDTKFG